MKLLPSQKDTIYHLLNETIGFTPTRASSWEGRSYPGSWDSQLRQFSEWLGYLKREVTSPNKWERLHKELESLKFNFRDDKTKFSAQEFEDIKVKIETLKRSINEIGLLEKDVAVINSKLDHLTEMAINLNKFDWKSLFIGTIISIVIQLNVTPDNAKALWSLINTVFNSYFLLP